MYTDKIMRVQISINEGSDRLNKSVRIGKTVKIIKFRAITIEINLEVFVLIAYIYKSHLHSQVSMKLSKTYHK